MAITKDLGIVSAYGYAKSKGYTGTEEEFALLMADYAEVAGEAEAWAAGTKAGVPVSSTDPAYHNNAKYYAEDAGDSASAAAGSASAAATDATDAHADAQSAATNAALAVNSATAAEASKNAAAGSASTASTKAGEAANSATAAAGSATSAGQSAGTATTKAGEASASATAAAASAGAAASSVASLAHPYDATATYNIGDYVIYNGVLYRCTTAIPTAEAWNAAHWTAATLADDVEAKANPDGYYENMTVGNAEQLVATVAVEDQTPYNFRTSGGSASIGDRAQNKIVGGTYAWNQLVQSAPSKTHTSTLTSWNLGDVLATNLNLSHKYLIRVSVKSKTENAEIRMRYPRLTANFTVGEHWFVILPDDTVFRLQYRSNDGASATIELPDNYAMCFDLTQMFGSTIADYIYTLEQGEVGAGVAWFRKLFPLSYYPYAKGGLESVNAGAYKTTGLNQWDEEWELGYIQPETGVNAPMNDRIRSKNFCRCLENTNYYCKIGTGNGTIIWYDINRQWIKYNTLNNNVLMSPTGAAYFKISLPSTYGTTYKGDICINLNWSGSMNGEYEPYTLHDYPLDSSLTLRGIPKLDASGNLYYDGDEYESDGSVKRRYGIVDLGTLTWTKVPGTNESIKKFQSDLNGIKSATSLSEITTGIKCAKYLPITANSAYLGNSTGIAVETAARGIISIHDPAYYDVTAAEFKASLSGVYLVYELAEPTEETAEPFQSLAVVNDWGTEEFTDASFEAGTRSMEIPVGHVTFYPENLRDKVQNSPAPSDSGDGLYNVRQVNGKLSLEADTAPGRITALEAKLPAPPTADGSYTLGVTVTDGTPTYSWITA